jgi:hypothetical protein
VPEAEPVHRSTPNRTAQPAGAAAVLLHLQATGGNQMALRMLAQSGGTEATGDDLAQRIRVAQRGGEPLRDDLRAEAQHTFAGLGDVRVHRDAEAASLAGSLGARAFTTGRDIFFGAGQYDPDSSAGFTVLHHELAHTVQQQAGAVPSRSVSPQLLVSTPGDRDERAADAAAASALANRSRADPPGSGNPVPAPCVAVASGTGGGVAVHRFGSAEHVRIGAEAAPGQDVLITSYGKISYGEMIALADYFGSVTEISTLASAYGTWGREQIDYALWKVNPAGRPRPSVSQSAVEAVDSRYYRLAARNETHFSTGSSPGRSNREQYVAGHADAIRGAYYEGLNPLVVRPWTWSAQEAFAAHFLTDAFSAGHVRTPRGEIQQHWEGLYPNFRDDLVRTIACHMAAYINDHDNVGYVATVGMLSDGIADHIRANAGPALAAFSIGDLISKVMHDADNAGLDVVSPQGPPGAPPGPFRWRAVGDDFLFPSTANPDATRTAQMAVEATRLSYEEGSRAYTAGLTGSQTLSALMNPAGFRALALIPAVDPASTGNPVYPWRAGGIAALDPVLQGLLAGAFAPGKEVRNGLDHMAVPATIEKFGFTLRTGDAWACFRGLLLADPFAMIVRIGNRHTCPAGENSPC